MSSNLGARKSTIIEANLKPYVPVLYTAASNLPQALHFIAPAETATPYFIVPMETATPYYWEMRCEQ